MSSIKNLYKWLEPGIIALIISLMIVLQVLAVVPSQAQEVICATEYIVQADDRLAHLADRYYGDASAASVIISATNQKHITDSAFASVTASQPLNTGDRLCITNGG
jgi:hypothetical protein